MKVVSVREVKIHVIETDDEEYPLWRLIEGTWWSRGPSGLWEEVYDSEYYGEVQKAYEAYNKHLLPRKEKGK